MTGSGGVSSTPRFLDDHQRSGILDHPLSRMMTARALGLIHLSNSHGGSNIVIASEAKQSMRQQ
jgi:hypothetical protein